MGQGRSYSVVVEEVHSGDDLIVMADLGIDKLFKRVRVRLQGVDAPNAYKAKGDSAAGQVRDEVRRIADQGKCRIEVVAEGKGGWLGILYVVSGSKEINVNEFLRGLGFVYRGKEGSANAADSPRPAA